MASEYVLDYGNFGYNFTYDDYNDYYLLDPIKIRSDKNHNPNARSDFTQEKIENILAKIDKCNYELREQENTGTDTRNQTMNKEDSIKRVDQKSVCGIEHTDLKAALEYLQAGFQNDWKISNSLRMEDF